MHPLPTLYIDSNDMFRDIVSRLLMHHFQKRLTLIGTFSSAAAALSHPADDSVQLVLLGLGSADRHDTSAIASLRSRWPDRALVVLSYVHTVHYQRQQIAAGADMVVAKDQIATVLLPAIASAVAARCVRRN